MVSSLGMMSCGLGRASTYGLVLLQSPANLAEPPGKGRRGAEGAVSHLLWLREHSELTLSALLKVVMVCLRSRDVGSTSLSENCI